MNFVPRNMNTDESHSSYSESSIVHPDKCSPCKNPVSNMNSYLDLAKHRPASIIIIISIIIVRYWVR